MYAFLIFEKRDKQKFALAFPGFVSMLFQYLTK